MANVIYSRAILYNDASGIETGVSFDPTYRLGEDDKSYVAIEGVGDGVKVCVDHIEHLIEWLQSVAELDAEYRAKSRGTAEGGA